MIDEPAEMARAERASRRSPGVRARVSDLVAEAQHALEGLGKEGFARLVRGASDSQLERRFGNSVAQRALFGGMARQFDPKFAFGFEGDIVYELTRVGNGRAPDRWTIRVGGESAEVVPGGNGQAAVTLRLSVADFARLAAEEVDPQELIFSDRFGIEGDLGVAAKLQEMFGGPARF